MCVCIYIYIHIYIYIYIYIYLCVGVGECECMCAWNGNQVGTKNCKTHNNKQNKYKRKERTNPSRCFVR